MKRNTIDQNTSSTNEMEVWKQLIEMERKHIDELKKLARQEGIYLPGLMLKNLNAREDYLKDLEF